jgi:REP element-mobilizing transposase RayT
MSYVSAYFHCVFGTKDRRPLLSPEIRDRLWPYLGGVANENKIQPLQIGGVADHVHMLISLPPTMPIAKAMQLIKGGSSMWLHETFPDVRLLGWQDKYAAFSVSVSQIEAIIKYIQGQEKHHRKVSFETEFIALLRKHGVRYEERFLWA